MFRSFANTPLLIAFLLLFSIGCNRSQPKADDSPAHTAQSVVPPEQSILHKTVSLQKYESFEVTIPAHCLHPRLHGTLTSFHYGEQGNRLSDEAANIDVLLLDEQQFNDFVNGPGEGTTRAAQNTHDQQIDWALPSSYDNPRKFFLVLNNATGKPKTKMVAADVTLSFD